MHARTRTRLALAFAVSGALALGLVVPASLGSASAAEAPDRGIGTALSTLTRTFDVPTVVDHLRVVGGSTWTATLELGDGFQTPVVPDADGVADLALGRHTVTTAQLTIEGADSAVDRWSLDRVGAANASTTVDAPVGPTASVTASSSPETATALGDGDLARGTTGAEWSAAAGVATASVQWDYSAPRRVSSVQVFGPSASYVDPAATGSAALNGTLVFSDGSRVIVSGIGSGGAAPTTLAFAARDTSFVRLELAKTISQARIGLREFAVYQAGTTPVVWKQPSAAGYSFAPETAVAPCTTASPALGTTTDGSPALVCPATGTRVAGSTDVVVSAPAGATLIASAYRPTPDGTSGATAEVGRTTAAADGRARFVIDTGALQRGPVAVRVVASSSTRPLYVQLDNAGGIPLVQSSTAPDGMTLAWDDEFRSPIAASVTGANADYMVRKTEYWGGSEFGDAIFADPAKIPSAIGTVDDDYLRLRMAAYAGKDGSGWNRKYTSGLISSLKVGATGFSAQYGYFEARILGAPGKGTWPAFWIMSTEGATTRSKAQGEADAVELYGHDTGFTCRTTHDWLSGKGEQRGKGDCRTIGSVPDWALAWHTYGVRVTPTSTDYYLDGEKVMSHFAMAQNAEPFYFMLDLAAGGGYKTDLSPTGGISDMYVDWVRVYT